MPRPRSMKPQTPANDFREVQHFNQWWLWAIIAGMAFTGWWAFIEQIVLGKPWGNIPAPDTAVIVMWLALGIGMPIVMRRMRMIVRVSEGALHVRYVPFRHRIIPLQTITSATPCRYRPLRDFMGWGIRWMPGRGWVYSISGDQGVQLVLGKHRKLLIGSRNPEALAAAINAAQSPTDDGPREGMNDTQSRWSDESGDYGQQTDTLEDEPLFETTSENGQRVSSNRQSATQQKVFDLRHRLAAALTLLRARTRGAAKLGGAIVPAFGRVVARLQGLARRFGNSERVQRFAENPKAHAAEAANGAIKASKQARVHAGQAGAHAKENIVQAKQNVSQHLRQVRVPERVAEPAGRYLRNPQLIVDSFKKTG